MANPLFNTMQAKQSTTITPQMKEQVKALYSAYKGNPTAFINNAITNMPALKNNPLVMMAMNGGDPKNLFDKALSNAGISEKDFNELFE